jgi:hypothetical protein
VTAIIARTVAAAAAIINTGITADGPRGSVGAVTVQTVPAIAAIAHAKPATASGAAAEALSKCNIRQDGKCRRKRQPGNKSRFRVAEVS